MGALDREELERRIEEGQAKEKKLRRKKRRERIKKESSVTVEPHGEGYHVTFAVSDMGSELLKVTVYVTDERQIEIVKRNFYQSAVDIYSDLISSLTVE